MNREPISTLLARRAVGALALSASFLQAAVAQSAAPVAAPTAPAVALASSPGLPAFAERLRAQHPGTRIDTVAASPVPGLYEVVMGRNVAYVDESGRYFLFGHVWDMNQRRDLTADLKASLDRVDPASLPLELALRHVYGKGTRALYVFADPTCGFCKQLEATLASVPDVTVYTFVVPVLGPHAKRIATAIACSADPGAAWSAWMFRSQEPALDPATAACEAGATRVAAAERLAAALGITGTPTLIAADGRKNAGFMPAAQLAMWLGAAPVAADGAARRSGTAAPVALITPAATTGARPTTPTAPTASAPTAPTLKTAAGMATAQPRR